MLVAIATIVVTSCVSKIHSKTLFSVLNDCIAATDSITSELHICTFLHRRRIF